MDIDPRCPDDLELGSFALGNLDHREFTRVARHVDGCPRCADRLERHDGESDPLLASLGSPRGEDGAGVPDTVLAAARQAIDAGESPAEEPGRPRRVGQFELLERIGRGSFGTVYRARDLELGRTVALKILRAGQFASEEEVDRFRREARSTAQLKHPGIVLLYGTGQADDETHYLIEELIDGETLSDALKRERPTHRAAARLVAEIASALDYAHRRGIIHRDIKPSNILLDRRGSSHLTDFGLAKWEADDNTMTPDGLVMGTPDYMSPEQARGSGNDLDERTDIYSLGVVLYELLTGERPFRGNRRMILLQVLEDEPHPPRRLDRAIPRDLETICLKAMAKGAAGRYASARAMKEDLELFLAGEPIRARRVGWGEAFWRWWRRNPVAASLLFAVSLASIFLVWHMANLTEKQMKQSALNSAENHAQLLQDVISQYSAKVVDRLGSHGIPATHDYARREGEIPLPATLLNEIGESMSGKKRGMQVRHYSDYPFRFREDGGPQDEFGWRALSRLRQDPMRPYYEFASDFNGVAALRYATARIMEESCVGCHNAHPDSVKTDWKPGDVRGVLEIVRPLGKHLDEARFQLKGTYAVMGGIFAALGAFSVAVLVSRGWRRRKNTIGN